MTWIRDEANGLFRYGGKELTVGTDVPRMSSQGRFRSHSQGRVGSSNGGSWGKCTCKSGVGGARRSPGRGSWETVDGPWEGPVPVEGVASGWDRASRRSTHERGWPCKFLKATLQRGQILTLRAFGRLLRLADMRSEVVCCQLRWAAITIRPSSEGAIVHKHPAQGQRGFPEWEGEGWLTGVATVTFVTATTSNSTVGFEGSTSSRSGTTSTGEERPERR